MLDQFDIFNREISVTGIYSIKISLKILANVDQDWELIKYLDNNRNFYHLDTCYLTSLETRTRMFLCGMIF